jgi:hypothetical protein
MYLQTWEGGHASQILFNKFKRFFSEIRHLHNGIWPDSSGFASTASPIMNVLRNLDLLELIFSYLAIPNTKFPIEKRLSKTGLLRAGLTCKGFFEPAMNLLWYRMESFLPLLLVIPSVTERGEIYVCSHDDSFYTTARLHE